jgi:sugar phosphate isomerase/epimerase
MSVAFLQSEDIVMKLLTFVAVLLVLCLPCIGRCKTKGDTARWPFFAFDNGVGRDQGWQPDVQAELLAELGYDGIGYTGLENIDARLAAMKALGLKVFSIYERLSLEDADPIPAERLAQLKHLEDTGAILWLTVIGRSSENEAIRRFRKVADDAARYGVRVAIYPHDNTYVATGEHALSLAKLVDRPNFGMSINVCHELKAGKGASLLPLVHSAGDRLFVVSVSGADDLADPQHERNWDRLIRPLGRGNFDLLPFLRELNECGYKGPIGLQCYHIRGEPRDVLCTSRRGWDSLLAWLAEQSE